MNFWKRFKKEKRTTGRSPLNRPQAEKEWERERTACFEEMRRRALL